jgi:hypothetical protein
MGTFQVYCGTVRVWVGVGEQFNKGIPGVQLRGGVSTARNKITGKRIVKKENGRRKRDKKERDRERRTKKGSK